LEDKIILGRAWKNAGKKLLEPKTIGKHCEQANRDNPVYAQQKSEGNGDFRFICRRIRHLLTFADTIRIHQTLI
jgi:hypothetical protein